MSEKCIKCGCDDPAMSRLIETVTRQDERLSGIDDKLGRICSGLYGTPEEPQRGLILRVDRMEQKAAAVGKMLWIIFTSVAGLIASKFWKGG